ncbi:YcgL domain-containing protein [Pasteurellaceae bacterium LIM206]|nr:YcgL domain-containing protein [Pasteurellaceae bacterium LIM206]
MLCAIYKSKKKEGMYLYVAKRDDFAPVPEALRALFGTPQFVMMFNLAGSKPLIRAENQEVLASIRENGFYLQMPAREENLLEQYVKTRKNNTAL